MGADDVWRGLLNKSRILENVGDVTISDEYVIKIYFPFYTAR